MSGKKKIFIGVGIVILLAAIAYANIRFKRTPGLEVTTEGVQKRHLEAIVSASGKIQPKRDVNISATTPFAVSRVLSSVVVASTAARRTRTFIAPVTASAYVVIGSRSAGSCSSQSSAHTMYAAPVARLT